MLLVLNIYYDIREKDQVRILMSGNNYILIFRNWYVLSGSWGGSGRSRGDLQKESFERRRRGPYSGKKGSSFVYFVPLFVLPLIITVGVRNKQTNKQTKEI